MRRAIRVAVATLAASVALLLPTAGAASAHPLGNFTVNRYTGIVVSPDSVLLDHVLDIAEIPTAARIPEIDRSGEGSLSRRELAEWARGACSAAAARLRLSVEGERRPLTVGSSAAQTLPGQGGLPVLRLECALRSDIGRLPGPTAVRVVDEGDEFGWTEMTARGDHVTLTRSDVPRRTASRRLTAYPRDLLSSPLDVTTARLQVRPGGAAIAPEAFDGVGGEAGRGARRFGVAVADLAGRYGGSPLLALAGLAIAVALGAAHALAPGHGKTVMAFYLSGRRGGLGTAAAVGATVTLTHTAGVLALGVLVSTGTSAAPAALYPWLSAISGALVVGVGIALLRQARRDHLHDRHHGHGHDHGHGHGHHHEGHSHRSLVAMGLAGGLLPSPSALLLFLAALGLGRAWFGVGLVLAFGAGMAITLAAVGLLALRLRERVQRRISRHPAPRLAALLRAGPPVSAGAVTLLGAVLALRGLAMAV